MNIAGKRWVQVLVGMAALCLIFFSLALGSGDNLIYRPDSPVSDFTITFWPNVHYIQRSMFEHGQWPLWRWSILSGTPFDSDPQSGLWYPPNALFLLFPINWGFNLLFWSHSVAAGVGMWLWSRSSGTSGQGAFISAIAYAFAPRAFAHLGFGHLGLFYAAAYIPWILWGARRVGQKCWNFLGVIGLAFGLQIIAHLQLAVYTSALAIGYILLVRISEWKELAARDLAGDALRAAAGFLIAAAVSGIQLIPLLRFAPNSARAQMITGGEIESALPPRYLLSMILPDHNGFADFMVYVGALALTLAILSLSKPEARLWTLAIGIMVTYAIVTGVGPIGTLVGRIPLLGWLRSPARVWFVVAAVLALMAGWGFDEIVRRKGSIPLAPSRLIAFGILIFVAFLLLGWRLLMGEIPGNLLQFGLGVSSCAVILLLWIDGTLSPRLFFGLLTIVLLLDLWIMDFTLVEGRSTEDVFAKTELGAAVAGRIGEDPWRLYSPSYSMPRQIAAMYALETVDGVDPLYLASYDEFMQGATGVEREHYSGVVPAMEGGEPVQIVNRDARPSAKLLGLLNVRYILSEFPMPMADFHLLEAWESTHIYENTQALPRAFLVNQTTPVRSATEAFNSLQRQDVSTVATVENGPFLDGSEFDWRVDWVERTPNRVSLRVDTAARSLLVLSQVWYFDWEARVDGDMAEIYRTDGILMGIELEPGSHTVTMDYRPKTLLWGILTSLVGFSISLTLLNTEWKSRIAIE